MLDKHFKKLVGYVKSTDSQYEQLYEPNLSVHPIPFFGNIKSAKILTVGVNPSNGEFKNRTWPEKLSEAELRERLLNYFDEKLSQPYWSWFQWWETALNRLNFSYKNGAAAHLDLSPRATFSMSKLSKNKINKQCFLKMAEKDIEWFFKLLPLCKNAKLLMMAGAVTNQYICNFTKRVATNFGYQMRLIEKVNDAPGPVYLYKLEGEDISLPVFFCGISPSANEPQWLIRRVEEVRNRLLLYIR